MAYRIIEGRLQKQTVIGGRWELVDRNETNRLLDLLPTLDADQTQSKPRLEAVAS